MRDIPSETPFTSQNTSKRFPKCPDQVFVPAPSNDTTLVRDLQLGCVLVEERRQQIEGTEQVIFCDVKGISE